MTVPPPEPPLALLQYWQRFPKRELRLWLNWGGRCRGFAFHAAFGTGAPGPFPMQDTQSPCPDRC